MPDSSQAGCVQVLRACGALLSHDEKEQYNRANHSFPRTEHEADDRPPLPGVTRVRLDLSAAALSVRRASTVTHRIPTSSVGESLCLAFAAMVRTSRALIEVARTILIFLETC